MFRHILLPTDGSPLSEAVVRKGIHFVKTIRARMTGLCVAPKLRYLSYDSELSADIRKQMAEACRAQAEKSLSVIEAAARAAGVPCDIACETNDFPYEAIIKVAEEKACDLIIMASHRPELRDYLLGPNAARVVRQAKQSVLVVRD